MIHKLMIIAGGIQGKIQSHSCVSIIKFVYLYLWKFNYRTVYCKIVVLHSHDYEVTTKLHLYYSIQHYESDYIRLQFIVLKMQNYKVIYGTAQL